MIALAFANKGTGKTTYLAKLAQKALKSKKYTHVFSNVPIHGTYEYDIDKYLGKKNMPRNSLLLIDEGAIVLPNTEKMTKEQAMYFILSRHAEVDIWCISQSWEDINIKVRRLYDKIYFLKRGFFLKNKTILVEYKKKLEVDEETHQFVDGYYKTPWCPFVTRKYVWRPNWYRYFDSYDMPDLGTDVPLNYWNTELPPTTLSKLIRLIDAKYKQLTNKNIEPVEEVEQEILPDKNKSFV